MPDPSGQPDEPEQQQAAPAPPPADPQPPPGAELSDYAFTTTEVGDEVEELPDE
ncbi:hypothetical protein [Streptomyces scabiei]|uniref:Uncharacterized protein n=1 Tax=Streptomyces scabiei TaxID=1930 RepID=A0A100JTA5_STRSC|nr:hypothetical protein [Streptomyces scabiei]GAQ65294.1 hypothetical protein SsS58_05703 [Streptomyces scabiei]